MHITLPGLMSGLCQSRDVHRMTLLTRPTYSPWQCTINTYSVRLITLQGVLRRVVTGCSIVATGVGKLICVGKDGRTPVQ